jgi:hypothetical protein
MLQPITKLSKTEAERMLEQFFTAYPELKNETPQDGEPNYKDLWLDLYEYVLGYGRGADHWRSIMEEMDPSLLED